MKLLTEWQQSEGKTIQSVLTALPPRDWSQRPDYTILVFTDNTMIIQRDQSGDYYSRCGLVDFSLEYYKEEDYLIKYLKDHNLYPEQEAGTDGTPL